MGRAAKAELQRKFETHAQGYEKMLEYSRQGEEKKSEYQKELEQYENDIGVVESEIETICMCRKMRGSGHNRRTSKGQDSWDHFYL